MESWDEEEEEGDFRIPVSWRHGPFEKQKPSFRSQNSGWLDDKDGLTEKREICLEHPLDMIIFLSYFYKER